VGLDFDTLNFTNAISVNHLVIDKYLSEESRGTVVMEGCIASILKPHFDLRIGPRLDLQKEPSMVERMEFCPKCNGNRRMVVSLGLMPIDICEGLEDILLFHYHCASCNSYVRSIGMDHEDYLVPDVLAVFSTAALV
jgi:hypothetical protein